MAVQRRNVESFAEPGGVKRGAYGCELSGAEADARGWSNQEIEAKSGRVQSRRTKSHARHISMKFGVEAS